MSAFSGRILETRPLYAGKARIWPMLWETGKREEAVTHYQDMLRLNPNDNQGIRYILLTALLFLGRDKEAAALHKRIRATAWRIGHGRRRCFFSRTKGDGEEAERRLCPPLSVSIHVVDLLLGRKKLRNLPPYISLGDKDEAVSYV